jgi:hypothetical protein
MVNILVYSDVGHLTGGSDRCADFCGDCCLSRIGAQGCLSSEKFVVLAFFSVVASYSNLSTGIISGAKLAIILLTYTISV